MFLTRLYLNPRNRAVQRDLNDCYQLHRTVLSMFPQAKKSKNGARSQFKILFRVEGSESGRIIKLLIQSMIKPDVSKLNEKYTLGANGNKNIAVKNIEGIFTQFENDRKLRFRLRANPTRKINTSSKEDRLSGEKKNGIRVPITSDEELVKWLKRKSQNHGFEILNLKISKEIPNVRISSMEYSRGVKKKPTGKSGKSFNLKFDTIQFDGVLKINELDKFSDAIKNGVGSGKAFGYGMLSIAPL